ncbi:MAG: DISARM system helicase DrmA [Acidobacteriota bacterium]
MANRPSDLRERLVRALEADLIGPFDPETGDEVLPLPPMRWYLTGFLAPQGGRDLQQDPTQDDELAAEVSHDEEAQGTEGESEAKQKNRLPASMGLSVLLPPGTETVRVRASWAEYEPEEREAGEKRRPKRVWRRIEREPVARILPLDPRKILDGIRVTDDGVYLAGKLETVDLPAPGTRALSLFLVNGREPLPAGPQDTRCLFQARLEIACDAGIVARPNRADGGAQDFDARVADLQFRDRCEYAVGHGVSVAVVPPGDGPVQAVRTAWIPCAEVPRVVTGPTVGVTAMEDLAGLEDGDAVRRALDPIRSAYAEWIATQRALDPGTDGRRATRDELMDQAERACRRIEEGIELLQWDGDVRHAFCLANEAMALAARKRNPERHPEGDPSKRPSWHLFQLAFLLLNLPALADPKHEDRDDVELIFFPTGGGKTEAYLGVIAFVLILRRIQGTERQDLGYGVAVILRYTLRLLTLDQLARAATLVCALETLRREDPDHLGRVRFAVGLWVGRTATANTLEEVRKQILDYKNSSSAKAESPFPLTHCPWCGSPLGRDSLTLGQGEVIVGCGNFRCDFAPGRHPEGLPVLFVDEQIYRELPAFLLSTVDKLAMLPWRGEAGLLFGRAVAREGRRFWGPVDAALGQIPGKSTPLQDGLLPPELIVQDELHLISGPLGTMTGLYETAVETLCLRRLVDGAVVKPKILASTATVRRAREQILSLFGRGRTSVFPPPGVDDGETWFARVDRKNPGRLYVGVAATGRAMKAILLRSYVALLAAANRLWDPQTEEGGTADAWMTLVGYFNSLRELGGMRRLVEDEVRTRCDKAEDRRPEDWTGPHPWFRNRRVAPEPVELTSREDISRIKSAKTRLQKPFEAQDGVDVVLASNMISVGVDIDRLGLMVVAGQPKTTSEYIQASSRVGRKVERPGLVVTCFNLHKPRDRSHYERFPAYHESFYRFVEASSLTPFSGPALDRGLAGTLLAIARQDDPVLTPSAAAMTVSGHRDLADKAVEALAERGAGQPGIPDSRKDAVKAGLAKRARALVESWEKLAQDARDGGYRRVYSPWAADRNTSDKPMLRQILDPPDPQAPPEAKDFTAPTSMRDVEPSTHLWRKTRLGGQG